MPDRYTLSHSEDLMSIILLILSPYFCLSFELVSVVNTALRPLAFDSFQFPSILALHLFIHGRTFAENSCV